MDSNHGTEREVERQYKRLEFKRDIRNYGLAMHRGTTPLNSGVESFKWEGLKVNPMTMEGSVRIHVHDASSG